MRLSYLYPCLLKARQTDRGEKRMRFIHIADVHLGACPDAGKAYSQERPRELWDTFAYVIEICEKEKTDLLLIAGDLFHRQPLRRELREVDSLFSSLSHTKVVLMAGNHDYIKKDSYYSTFSWSKNVYPLFGKEMEYIEFPELHTAVYGFSYHEREIREARYDSARPVGVQPFEILLAHGGDERHIPVHREQLIQSGFDYVALGHIHKAQELEKNRLVYAGALEPIDKNDTGRHGLVKGVIDSKGCRVSRVPLAKREYIHLKIHVEEDWTARNLLRYLEEQIQAKGRENLYQITLEGTRDADAVFEAAYLDPFGNVLEVSDETKPAYDFERLRRENSRNLLGKYIELFQDCEEGTVQYKALCKGVEALLENMQG